jgi:beta-ureidopropionase
MCIGFLSFRTRRLFGARTTADQEDPIPMARIVRAALLQAEWTGDKESMIEKHEKYAREAAAQGAKVMCFQELFYGPYFCQVQDPQYFSYTEHIPNGPTTKRMQELAKETGMVLIVPMYEEDEQTTGIYYNTAAVIDADGSYLGKYRKTHIPHVKGFWEKYYFRPGTWDTPSSTPPWARSACTSATTATSPKARGRSA